jgi:hypothetical protein
MKEEIATFAHALFDNIANDAKCPAERVESALSTWIQRQQDIESIEQYKADRYLRTIHDPRTERLQAYEEYLLEKQRLWKEWRYAKESDKKRIFRDYIKVPLPEILDDGVDTNTTYTKNVVLL